MEIQIEKRLFFEFFSRKKNQIEKTVIFRVTFHEKKIQIEKRLFRHENSNSFIDTTFSVLTFQWFRFHEKLLDMYVVVYNTINV